MRSMNPEETSIKGGLSVSKLVGNVRELGIVVRSQRKSLGLSQAEVARFSDVGIRFISDLENGKPTIELTKVLQVLHVLGLEIMLKNKGWT